MNGRINYQHCYVQEVRADEIFQISWVRESILGARGVLTRWFVRLKKPIQLFR